MAMNLIQGIKDVWLVFRHPTCWVRCEPTCKTWDAYLRSLIGRYQFSEIKQHTAQLGPVTLWISNHPYASFTPELKFYPVPSRATAIRLGKKLRRETTTQIISSHDTAS